MALNNVTLALDLSLSSPGFAVIAVTDEGDPILLEKSHVKTNANQSHGYRLHQIAVELERLMLNYKPEHIVRERGFSRFPTTTQALFKVVGVSDFLAQITGTREKFTTNIYEIAPTTVKKAVTGNGRASKKDVEKEVAKWLQIDRTNFFETDDESDAAAVGLAYLVENGITER